MHSAEGSKGYFLRRLIVTTEIRSLVPRIVSSSFEKKERTFEVKRYFLNEQYLYKLGFVTLPE